MASYKWGYKSPNMGYNYTYLSCNPRITPHEPPSMDPKPYTLIESLEIPLKVPLKEPL